MPDCPKPCKDGETKGHLISPVPADCLTCICKEKAKNWRGAVERTVLETKMGFQCRVVLGELMHAVVTARLDVTHSVTTLSKSCKCSVRM